MNSWPDRYREGQRGQVWVEMVGLGVCIRDEENLEEAREVGALTMQAARRNIERLMELLPAHGYEFAAPHGTNVFVPPVPTIKQELDTFEELVGPMPIALRCWFEEVGQVNLIGSHPDWRFEYTDPLVLDSPLDYLTTEFELWLADKGTEWERGPYRADLAPDYLHKADVSGGAPYSMAVPDASADALLLWERHQTTLVNYLRTTFAWAGLPGWESGLVDTWASPSQTVPSAIREIAAKLEPI